MQAVARKTRGSRAALFLLTIAGFATSGCLEIAGYPKASIPVSSPIYSELSVGLYFPRSVTEQYLAFNPNRGFFVTDDSELAFYRFGQAFDGGLTRALQAYFPRMTTFHKEPPPPNSCDLLIEADLKAVVSNDRDDDGVLILIMLTGSLNVLARDGRLLEQFPVKARGGHFVHEPPGEPYDLSGQIAANYAIEALRRDASEFWWTSQAVSNYLLELRELQSSQPSELITAVGFEDSQGLLPNQRLDAGEVGDLVVRVENHGPGTAYGVTVAASAEQPDLELPNPQNLGELPPGENRTIRLPIKAGLQLTDGNRQILIETQEKRGYNARKALLELPTVGLLRPVLQISDILLDDQGGRAIGDGDGRPSNGETVEATVFVRNSGTGDAGRVGVLLTSVTPRVEILEGKNTLETVPAGQLRQARFLLRLPHTLSARELALQATAVEGRGEKVAQAQLVRSWPVLLRNPSLEVDWRIFDGTSPASAGNKDGRVSNGERIEILLTPINRGAVEARDVTLDLVSADAGVAIKPGRVKLPDLPPGTAAPPVSMSVEVPRTFQGERLSLRAKMEQRDFPKRESEISIPVFRLLPSVDVRLSEASALQQGERRQLQLQIENRGDLGAQNVRLQIVSRWPNLDILGEKNVGLGSLAPHATAVPVSLDLFAKRAAAAGRATLEVTVQQDDFAPAVHEVPIDVTAEAPTYVQAEPEVPRGSQGRTGGSSKPVIIFRRYEDGQIVPDEEVHLAFEIYDEAGLAHVGVTLNGRPLSLPHADAGSGGNGAGDSRQGNRYSLPIKLDPGTNKVEVMAISFDGGSVSRALTLTYTARPGQVWAAVIGISRYEDPALSLQYADTDAEAIATYFRTEAGIPADHMLVLKNEQATRRQVIEAIGDWLPRRAEANDTVILYFAGHGAHAGDPGNRDGVEEYLLPFDASTKSFNSTSINFEELNRQVGRIHAGRIILILDTCFSGAAAGGRTVFDPVSRSRDVLTDDFLVDLTGQGKGTVLLMASGVNELAFEPPDLGHGVFTFYFLEGLRGRADASPFGNADGLISVDEAYLYASRKVREKTRDAQKPQKFGGGSGEIVLGRVRAGAPR